MSGEHQLISIESFSPRLREGVERFALPDGDTGLYGDWGGYLRVPAPLAPLLDSMDGRSTLSSLAVVGSQHGRMVSTRALLQLMGELSRGGWLESDADDLDAVGLPSSPGLTGAQKLTRALFGSTLGSERLGRVVSTAVMPFCLLPASTKVVAGLCAASLAVVVAWAHFGNGQLPADPLYLDSSYSAGLLAVYGGGCFALLARQLARGWALGAARVGVYRAGIELRLLLLGPSLDGRHIFRAGRGGELRLAVAGLGGTLAAVALLATLSTLAANADAMHTMALAGAGAVLVLLGVACPFFDTDLGRTIDLSVPDGRGRQHALTYLTRRLLKQQGGSELFAGELHHLLVAVAVLAWVYEAFGFGASALSTMLGPAASLPAADVSALDKAAVLAVLAGGGAIFSLSGLAFFGGALRLAMALIPKKLPEPMEMDSDTERAAAALGEHPLVAHLSEDARKKVAARARLLSFSQGQDIVRQGDEGDCFYLIASGEARVIVTAQSGVEVTVATLRQGDGFGEVALVEDGARSATVRALSESLEAFAIDQAAFHEALRQADVPLEKVTAIMRASQAIRRSDVFRDMAPAAIAKVVGMCSRESRAAGDVVIRQGDVGDRFYVIEAGAVNVERQAGDAPVAELGPGDFFGEIALLTDTPRNATVRCMEPCVLLSLDRDRFRKVMTVDFSAGMRLEQIAERRVGGNPCSA